MRLTWFNSVLPISAAALLGCSATVSASSDGADAEASSTTAAVVVVERTSGATDTARGEAVARFMRVRGGGSDEALRVVGATVDFPALGTCVSLSTLSASKEPAPMVQLLDVGAVSMEANGVQTTLLARRLPDVVDLVSGVVYARATDAELLPPRARYVVRVSGTSDEIAPFVVDAGAPGDPGDVRVSGQEARLGFVSLPASGPAELTWEAGNAEDLVYVDVTAEAQAGLGRTPTIRCAFADSGRALISSNAFAAGDEGTLSIHRLHRERFRARGIDSGEVRFDFARVVSFTRR